MKNVCVSILGLVLLCEPQALNARQVRPSQPGVNLNADGSTVALDGDHRKWTDASGHQTVEIATGMNYWDGRQWSASDPGFHIMQDGSAAVANQTQHKVRLAANLNTINAVTVTTPDGLVLNSTPVGIALYDAASGNFATIAWITNCTGLLVASNKVVYSNAFVGLCADVVYTMDYGSFEQDVVINGHLNPADFGFPANTTRIQILTEFYKPPSPEQITRPIYVESNESLRNNMISPDFVDHTLGFGEFVLNGGRAFTGATTNFNNGAAVGKQFLTITNGASTRTFLIESVQYPSIHMELNSLPECDGQQAANGAKPNVQKSQLEYAAMPSPHPAGKDSAAFKQFTPQVAANGAQRPLGLVVDYIASIGGALSGTQVFQGDTTYYVSNSVTCNGAVTIEGGAVFKYPTNSVSLTLNNSLTLATSNYRPVVFTAADDDSVGDKLSTGIWSGYTGTIRTSGYGNPALKFGFVFSGTLSNLRFRYSKGAIQFLVNSGNPTVTFSHSQLINCVQGINIVGTGISGTLNLNVNNCLLANVQSPMASASSSFSMTSRFTDSTLDNSQLGDSDVITGTFTTTNCILANNSSSHFTGNNNGFFNSSTFGTYYSSSSSPFQTVGAANYYLNAASNFRGVGLTNINSALLAQLQQKTTQPPLVCLNGTILFDATLFPQAPRDKIGLPDLGYHYDPIDFALGSVYLTNVALTVAPGTVIAGFDPYAVGYALTVGPGAQLISVGTPANLNRIINFNTVQEQSTNWTKPASGIILANWTNTSPTAVINCEFTDFSILANDTAHIYAASNGNTAPINLQHCQLHGGSLTSFGPTVNLTNCLLERVTSQLWSFDGNAPFVGNNLFWQGTNNLIVGSSATVRNNMFDKTLINDHSSSGYTGGYNGYITNFNHLTLVSNDKVLTSSSYQTGALGSYYLPTTSSLINNGSTTADALGLYHFTTTTNQAKETTSTVDIGYHYVAVDGSGNPLDADGDGIPDYLEDSNGNGIYNMGTDLSDWQTYNSTNNLGTAPGLVVFTPLK